MKFLKLAFIASALSLLLIGCSKSTDDPTPSFSIEGTWKGTLGTGFVGFIIKSGGTLDRVASNGDVYATGNWQLTGDTFDATYTFNNSTSVITVTGTVNKSKNTMGGTWKNSSETGTWSTSKVE